MTKEIKLTNGLVTLVDDEDYEYLNQFKWHYHTGYAIRSKQAGSLNTSISMHRIVLERKLGRPLTASEKTDHRDRNRANNTRDNLRLATHQQNMMNKSKYVNASSRFLGVSWAKNARKWTAQIRIDGHLEYLGSFTDEEEAARAYDKMALITFGEFANLNFPIIHKAPGLRPSSKLTLLKLEINGRALLLFNVYDEVKMTQVENS